MLTFIKLFRFPNLVITALAMVLVRYCLVKPVFNEGGIELQMPFYLFVLLILSTLLIAAAGYVINDYFDIRIDRFNNPKKIVLGKKIPIRKAILYHSVLNIIGVAIGFFVAIMVGNFKLGFIHVIASFLLWMYSSKYKRSPLIGNVIVAFSAALTILLVWLFEFFAMINNSQFILPHLLSWINKLVIAMALLAFFITLIRELIKDIEDVKGDERYGCRTLPVLWGCKKSRNLVVIIIILLMGGLGYVQSFLIGLDLKMIFYYLGGVQIMLVYLIWILAKAKEKEDFSYASQFARVVILSGILSMEVFFIS